MTASIVVLGATGYAGGLAVESLLARGLRPIVAGSRERKIAEAAERWGGLEHRVADASDLDSVKALVSPGDVLVTTVGPFDRLGRTVARAAAEQGAHYVDSTGEVGFVRDLIRELDATAQRTGAVMLPAFGNDYVPGLLAGELAIQDAEQAGGSAHTLEVGYFARGGFGGRGVSHGTRRTLIGELGRPAFVRRHGRLGRQRFASTIETFDVDGSPRDAILASGTEVLFLPRRHDRLDTVAVYNGWFPDGARLVQQISIFASLIERTSFGRSLVERLADRFAGPPGGPDAAERAKSQAISVAVARDAAGRELSRVEVVGTSPYTLTGDLMAWGAEQLAMGRGRTPGVTDPLAAFGVDATVAGCADLGLARSSRGTVRAR